MAEQKLESSKYLMFPKTVFSGDNTSEAHQHWTNFEKYVTTQAKHNTLASQDELCDAFLATLSERAYHWSQTLKHTITNTNDLQIAFLKKFNKWGDAERDLNCALNKLTFNSNQHTVQEFTQELDLLEALIGATNAQIIDKFKECFPPEIESQLLNINDLDHLVTKANQLVQLFKPKSNDANLLLSHSAQQQIMQNTLSTNEIQKEYKVPIGSKWNNKHQQKSRVHYQNACNQKGPGQPNNQI